MYYVDRYLQKARIKKARKYIRNGQKILDIGSNQGEFFDFYLKKGIKLTGVGIEPLNTDIIKKENYYIINDFFPSLKLKDKDFDLAILLAVLEHIPMDIIPSFAQSIYESLNKGGKLIITVPSPQVDRILEVLAFFRIIKGMSLEEHYGYDVKQTISLFESAGFKTIENTTFQFGLNNLFVFEK